jgi:hypothetical protein
LSNLAQSIVPEFVNSAVKSVFSEIGKLLGASLAGSGGSSGDQDFWGGITGAGEDIAWVAGFLRVYSVPAVS